MNNYEKSYGEVEDFKIEEENKYDIIVIITYVVISLILCSFCFYECLNAYK